VVPVEDVTPEAQGAAGGAPEPMEVAAGEAATTTGGEGDDALPEPALHVVVRSLEIQDAELIRPAPVGVLDQQTYQGGTRGSRLCSEDRDRETKNSKVCARTRDTQFIQVRVAKVANPTSCLEIK
jgi:hypothetical protein